MYVVLGTIGLATSIKTVSANQIQSPGMKPSISQTQSQSLQKISARDDEADEKQENQEHLENHQQTQESDENEANEGPNDRDSGSQEDSK